MNGLSALIAQNEASTVALPLFFLGAIGGCAGDTIVAGEDQRRSGQKKVVVIRGDALSLSLPE